MLETNRKRYTIATYQIQQALMTLCMYCDDEKVEEYVRKIEDMAKYYKDEERKLIEKEKR